MSCATHCCPVHGCKYGDEDCEVYNKKVKPVYESNNGCESCEFDREQYKRFMEEHPEVARAMKTVEHLNNYVKSAAAGKPQETPFAVLLKLHELANDEV